MYRQMNKAKLDGKNVINEKNVINGKKYPEFTAYSITKKSEVGQNKELHLHFLQIH